MSSGSDQVPVSTKVRSTNFDPSGLAFLPASLFSYDMVSMVKTSRKPQMPEHCLLSSIFGSTRTFLHLKRPRTFAQVFTYTLQVWAFMYARQNGFALLGTQ